MMSSADINSRVLVGPILIPGGVFISVSRHSAIVPTSWIGPAPSSPGSKCVTNPAVHDRAGHTLPFYFKFPPYQIFPTLNGYVQTAGSIRRR